MSFFLIYHEFYVKKSSTLTKTMILLYNIPSFVFIVADIQISPSFVQLKMLAYKQISNHTSGIFDLKKKGNI